MHSTTCGIGATATSATFQTSPTDGQKMVHNSEDPMNKIPLKSSSGLADDEKNGGEFVSDTAAAQEAKREQMRANILKWMKKLTIGLICFIGVALITYVIISLCFNDWPKSTPSTNLTSMATTAKTIAATTLPPTRVQQTMQETSTPFVSLPPIAQTTSTSTATAPTTTTETETATTESSTTHELNSSLSTTDENTSATGSPSSDSTSRIPTAAPFIPIDMPRPEGVFHSKLGVFEQAAACSDKQVCSEIASHIMKQGGSAVDGAISALLCNGIASMQSMGIGGSMLMNVYIKDENHAYSIDASGVAPFSAYAEMFDDSYLESLHGGRAITVPGELMGYHRAHERFGKLPWKKLVEPAIQLCESGIYMSPHMDMGLELKSNHLKNNSLLVNMLFDPITGEKYPIGTKLKPPKELCQTYKMLAENGPLDFYNGTLTKLVAEDLKDLGSPISAYDLESYSADLVSSITMQLGNETLHAIPPISSGTIVASILSILEGYHFAKKDLKGAKNQALTFHRITEAFKFGYAKRWELGDLRFNDVRELVSKLTNPEYNMAIRARINDTSVHKKLSDYDAQYSGSDDVGTSHMSFIAPNGDAVSVTSTVNDYFGSGQAGKRTGIIFNCGMNDFAIGDKPNFFGLMPSPANTIEPRKRAMSSMSPMILTDQNGDVRMVIGAAGGAKIISAIPQVMARVLWMGQNIKEAIDEPRIHHQLLPDTFTYEYGRFDEAVIKILEQLGHHTKPYKDIGSVVCAITRNETAVYANADYRKRGGVAGF